MATLNLLTGDSKSTEKHPNNKKKEYESWSYEFKEANKRISTSVDEAENGFIISQSTSIDDPKTGYSYECKKWISKTNPLLNVKGAVKGKDTKSAGSTALAAMEELINNINID